MPSEPTIDEINTILEQYRDFLDQKANVLGTAVGFAVVDGEETEELSIIVLVDRKVESVDLDPADLLPKELEGIRVDVQEIGEIRAS